MKYQNIVIIIIIIIIIIITIIIIIMRGLNIDLKIKAIGFNKLDETCDLLNLRNLIKTGA